MVLVVLAMAKAVAVAVVKEAGLWARVGLRVRVGVVEKVAEARAVGAEVARAGSVGLMVDLGSQGHGVVPRGAGEVVGRRKRRKSRCFAR